MRSYHIVSRALLGAALLACAFALPASAQRGFNRYFGPPDEFYKHPEFHGNPPYDGKFTFVRIQYRGYGHWSSTEGPGWSHDFPDADEHLMRIVKEVTAINPFIEMKGDIKGAAIISLEDPLIFKYPFGYLSEPGGWIANDKEIANLRNYLAKGGFILFDDFNASSDWANLQQIMRKAFPNIRPVQLTGNEPIFDSFFKIDLRVVAQQCMQNRRACYRGIPGFWGWYENGDPTRRLMAIGSPNGDIGEFWQWSGTGFAAVDQTNEVFKLGVNYIIYALTH